MSVARYLSKLAALLSSDGKVTTAGLADANVTPAKLSTGAPTWGSGGNTTTTSTGTSTSHRGNIVQTSRSNGSGYNVTSRLSDSVSNSADMSMVGGVTQFSNNGIASHTTNQYGIGLGTTTPSSGTGIAFPATQNPSSDANTLDDYEEGTWTPVFKGAADPTVTYTKQDGRYVKIGKMVLLQFDLRWSAFSGGSGTPYIGGIPFAAADGGYNFGVIQEKSGVTFTAGYYLTSEVAGGTTAYYPLASNGSSATASLAFSNFGASGYLIGGASVITAN